MTGREATTDNSADVVESPRTWRDDIDLFVFAYTILAVYIAILSTVYFGSRPTLFVVLAVYHVVVVAVLGYTTVEAVRESRSNRAATPPNITVTKGSQQ